MRNDLDKIILFIDEHHVMTLATSKGEVPQCCNLFYVYVKEENCFIVASDEKTEHIKNILINPSVAASIVLETKTVGKIQGLQIKGVIKKADDKKAKRAYFQAFPYARVMQPTLWRIAVKSMKLTDNRLGFGRKLIWKNNQ